jgi:hypothetical protein
MSATASSENNVSDRPASLRWWLSIGRPGRVGTSRRTSDRGFDVLPADPVHDLVTVDAVLGQEVVELLWQEC